MTPHFLVPLFKAISISSISSMSVVIAFHLHLPSNLQSSLWSLILRCHQLVLPILRSINLSWEHALGQKTNLCERIWNGGTNQYKQICRVGPGSCQVKNIWSYLASLLVHKKHLLFLFHVWQFIHCCDFTTLLLNSLSRPHICKHFN